VLLHDVPLVADVVADSGAPRPEVALLKGWHNYLCKHKVAGGYPTEDEPGLFAVDAATPSSTDAGSRGPLAEQVLRLREWAEESATGDRDDLEPGVSDRAWRQVSVTKLECLGAKCPMLEECFPEAARRAAHEADVVVTNHAMLGIAAAGSPRVLPEHDVLIVDEAHELADRVTAQATLELSAAAVDRTVRLARKHAAVTVDALDAASRAVGSYLEVAPAGRLRSVPAEMIDLGRSMGLGAAKMFFKIRLPYALPSLFGGLKVAITLAVVGAVVGEFVGADRGLGYLILLASGQLQMDIMFAAIVVLVVIGVALFAMVQQAERWALPWHASVRVSPTGM